MEIKLGCIAGDGIGPELVEQIKKVVKHVCEIYGHHILFVDIEAGSASVQQNKDPFTKEAYQQCKECHGLILGNMWMHLNPELEKDKRPSALLGKIRKAFNLSLNIRPNYLFESVFDLSPLKPEILKEGFDILLIRDLAGGELTGKRYRDQNMAYDVDSYTRKQIENLADFGFKASLIRSKNLMSLDKAVVLESSRFFREIVNQRHEQYKDVILKHQHIDDAASQIIRDPQSYDVIITNGMFGDILADEIAAMTGIQKMLPSAELNEVGFGLYTPNNLHNTDLNFGKDEANPIGLIMASALFFRYSLGLEQEAQCIEKAVQAVLDKKFALNDFCGKDRIRISQSMFVSKIMDEMRGN